MAQYRIGASQGAQRVKIMKFKVDKGSAPYQALAEYFVAKKAADEKARALAVELGATGYASTRHTGIAAFAFESRTPLENWKYADPKHNRKLHLPRAKPVNKPIFDKMKAIEFPSSSELDKALGWKGVQIIRMRWIDSLGHIFRPDADFALIDADPECQYEPLPDMTEITVSEYNRLQAELLADDEKELKQAA